MSNLSVSFSRTLCFFMRIRNCRYYNVKKFLHKGKLRGSDENVRSADTRKSGKRSGFKEKSVSSPKTRYDSDRIRISKLYASLQNAIMESVLEKSSNAERLFQKHLKNCGNVEDIGDIIRKRLEIHSVSHLDNFKKIELARSEKQKEVEKRSNRNDKFYNKNQAAPYNRIHDDNDVAFNMRDNNKEIKGKNEIDRLQNSRRVISAMANSQCISMSDKLAKADCLNYYKCNRKFNQNNDITTQKTSNNVGSDEKVDSSIQSDIGNMESVSLKSSNKLLKIHEKADSGIQFNANNSNFTGNSIHDSFDPEQSFIEHSRINDELKVDKDTLLKNADYSVNLLPSLADYKPKNKVKDESEAIQLSDGKTLEFQNNFEKRIDNLCTKNDEVNIMINPVLDKISHIASDEKSSSFEIDIQQVNGKNSLENPLDITQEKLDHQNKVLPGESLSTFNLNHENDKSNNHLDQNNTGNIIQETFLEDKIQEDSQSIASKPENIDKQEESKKPSGENTTLKSSKHLIDMMEFISGSKSQFSNLQKQLELFGLHEEAKNLNVFSKSITDTLEQTILDDVSSYLLGLQKSLQTYCSDNIGEHSGNPIITTSDNVLSVLDKYLKNPKNSEINKSEHTPKICNECLTCNEDSIQNTNKNKNSDNVHNGEVYTEKGESIDKEKNNLNISSILHNDAEEYDIGKEFAKFSDKGIADDQYEIGINNTNDSLSDEGNKFSGKNDIDLFDVSESGLSPTNHLRDRPTSIHNNDFVEDTKSSTVKSLRTLKNKIRHDVVESDEINSFTTDGKNEESSLNSEKTDDSLLLSTEQSVINSIDENSVSEDSKGSLKESHKKALNLNPGKASKLQNKKNLKAKTFLHPNYWKTHANSYHTGRGIPWVIGKKCSIETIEVNWESQNSDIVEENIVTAKQPIKMRDFQSSDFVCEYGKPHGESERKSIIGNQSFRRFNTCSKTQNILNRVKKSDELKLLNNTEYCKIKHTICKRDYSTDHVETEVPVPRMEREKKKLSVRELFPEKKKVQPLIQTGNNSKKEDIKLEVIGKKIVPQEVSVEEEIVPQGVLVEAAEEFLPSKSKYGISFSDVEGSGKQTQSSLDEPKRDDSGTNSKQFSDEFDPISDEIFHERTEEMILDGFGLSTSSSVSENSNNLAVTSVSNSFNQDDTSEIMGSNPETSSKLGDHTDENKPGKYDKAPIGFMQSPQNNQLKRSEENKRISQNTKLRINNYEEI